MWLVPARAGCSLDGCAMERRLGDWEPMGEKMKRKIKGDNEGYEEVGRRGRKKVKVRGKIVWSWKSVEGRKRRRVKPKVLVSSLDHCKQNIYTTQSTRPCYFVCIYDLTQNILFDVIHIKSSTIHFSVRSTARTWGITKSNDDTKREVLVCHGINNSLPKSTIYRWGGSSQR